MGPRFLGAGDGDDFDINTDIDNTLNIILTMDTQLLIVHRCKLARLELSANPSDRRAGCTTIESPALGQERELCRFLCDRV
jgi:hypothetical protein